MRFEFDLEKSRLNNERHGIDFEETQKLWESTHIIVPAKNVVGESRFAVIGKVRDKIYVAIFTERNEVLRLISCHRADRRWINIYERLI